MNKNFLKLLEKRWKLAQDSSPQSAEKLQALEKSIKTKYEKVVAPLVLDMSGFTRFTISHGIIHYLAMIKQMNKICEPLIEKHKGTIVKKEADNIFAHFPKVENAVESSILIQNTLKETNLLTSEEFDIYTSIGIGYGPVLLVDNDMWGSEFNLSSKLGEDIAELGEILLTESAKKILKIKKYQFKSRAANISGMPYTVHQLIVKQLTKKK